MKDLSVEKDREKIKRLGEGALRCVHQIKLLLLSGKQKEKGKKAGTKKYRHRGPNRGFTRNWTEGGPGIQETKRKNENIRRLEYQGSNMETNGGRTKKKDMKGAKLVREKESTKNEFHVTHRPF